MTTLRERVEIVKNKLAEGEQNAKATAEDNWHPETGYTQYGKEWHSRYRALKWAVLALEEALAAKEKVDYNKQEGE